jgi:hypothetical protein
VPAQQAKLPQQQVELSPQPMQSLSQLALPTREPPPPIRVPQQQQLQQANVSAPQDQLPQHQFAFSPQQLQQQAQTPGQQIFIINAGTLNVGSQVSNSQVNAIGNSVNSGNSATSNVNSGNTALQASNTNSVTNNVIGNNINSGNTQVTNVNSGNTVVRPVHIETPPGIDF